MPQKMTQSVSVRPGALSARHICELLIRFEWAYQSLSFVGQHDPRSLHISTILPCIEMRLQVVLACNAAIEFQNLGAELPVGRGIFRGCIISVRKHARSVTASTINRLLWKHVWLRPSTCSFK